MTAETEQIARFLARAGGLRWADALAIPQALPDRERHQLALALRRIEGNLGRYKSEARITSASIARAIKTGGR